VFGLRPIANNRCVPTTRHFASVSTCQDDIVAPRLDSDGPAVDTDVDAFILEDIRDAIGHVLVFACDETRCPLDDRDFAAEPPVDLCKLKSNVAAAEHDQMRGQKIHAHHRTVGQIRDPIGSGDWRHKCAATHVDENLVGAECLFADLHLFWPHKPSVPS
jgi:hypothetical protein